MYQITDDLGSVLCSIITGEETTERIDASTDDEILQVSLINLNRDVAPHKHYNIERRTWGTQEAWVIMQGRVEVTIYDTEDVPVDGLVLTAGACAVFYEGGHSIRPLTDDVKLYEIKNGPYYGPLKDKVRI